MNKLLFEQPKLTVETFSAKEDILLLSSVNAQLDDGTELRAISINPITPR